MFDDRSIAVSDGGLPPPVMSACRKVPVWGTYRVACPRFVITLSANGPKSGDTRQHETTLAGAENGL